MMILSQRTFFLSLLFSFFTIVTAVFSAWAETRYVSDQLIISMREGISPGSPAVAFLVAGTPLEVLEETEDHLFVRIANGQEGWVKSKYILAQRPKSMIIKELEAKVKELESEIQTMGTQAGTGSEGSSDIREIYELKIKNLEAVLDKEKQSAAATQTELKDLKNSHKKLRDDFNRLSKQNENLTKDSGGSEALNQEIKSLKQANQALNQEIDQLKTAGQPTMLSDGIKWFLIGGGVLLLGIILGRSARKKSRYGY
jgi:SH3 domain protein